MADKNVQDYDWGLMAIYLMLLGLGLVNLLSATSPAVGREGLMWVLQSPSKSVVQQFWFMLMGFVLMILVSRMDYRFYERMAYPIYGLCLVALLAVLLIGIKISGSVRWIEIGGIRLQPSEPGKLALIIGMAKYLQGDRFLRPYGLKELFVPVLMVAVPLVLLYFEPDLGTGLFYCLVTFTLLMFHGVKWQPLVIIGAFGVAGAIVGYHFLLHDYQQARILTFFNPQRDPLGSGYHVIQSLIAVGSGKFWGKGYLAGSQSQLKFLPEQHTDFIFSVLAEEWGFVGSFMLLCLYVGILLKGIDIALKARDRFGVFLAIGMVSMFFWQITINMGGVLGLLPLTGITLPFLSYGGSSILTLSVAVGILQSIRMRRFMF